MSKFVALFAFVVMSANALANEGVLKIAIDKAKKGELISAMQDQIARHEKMTKEEIVAELTRQAEKNREVVASVKGADVESFNEASEETLQVLASLDHEQLIALETARLQNLQTSKNKGYLFLFIRWNHDWVESASGYWEKGWTLIAMPFAIMGDLVLLPFEIIAELTITADKN